MKLGYLWRVIMRSSILRKTEREKERERERGLKTAFEYWMEKIKCCVSFRFIFLDIFAIFIFLDILVLFINLFYANSLVCIPTYHSSYINGGFSMYSHRE